MGRTLANFISVVLHPVWIPTLLFGIIFLYAPTLAKPLSQAGMLVVLGAIFITTSIFPLLSLWVFQLTGTISSIKLEKGEERLNPFLAITLFYGVATYMLAYKLKVSYPLVAMMGIITLLTLLVTLISKRYKISVHAAGISGLLGLLLGAVYKTGATGLFYPIVAIVILSGIVMSSRLYLKSHHPEEVFWGASLGLGLCFLSGLIIL